MDSQGMPNVSVVNLSALASAIASAIASALTVEISDGTNVVFSTTHPGVISGAVTMATLPDTSGGLLASIKGKTDNIPSSPATEGGNLATIATNTGHIPSKGSAAMSGALPVTLATDGPGVAALTQMSRWAPGLKSDGTAAAAAQAAASITADPAASATKVGSIVGGQTATLSCTMSAQAQDGTYWCNYIVVPSGAAAPTAGDGTIWAGQTVYIVAPGTAAYDVYAIRGAAGKIGMFCQLSLGQAAA